MEQKQTAVEWLVEKQLDAGIGIPKEWREQAKEMEKQQKIQLPSDEEIEQYLKSFPYTKHLDDGQYNDGVIVGAELAIEWMRDKIQGDKK